MARTNATAEGKTLCKPYNDNRGCAKTKCDNVHGCDVLVGNKADLAKGAASTRQVAYDSAQAWAADRGMSYVEVSAKTGANLRPVLLTILAEITEAASPDGR